MAYIFVVLLATLLFRDPAPLSIELDPIASYRRAMRAPTHLAVIEIRNIILNIAMFAPLGIFLPLFFNKFRKFRYTLPIAALASLSIETTQFITRRGVFAIEDLLHNVLGAALGLAFFLIFSKILKPTSK
ncbi:MAG: VanZ family protein [Defluviitaleaceae bacterium]|nr:VanZ family protein [Defluviitaleaceae bacterium]